MKQLRFLLLIVLSFLFPLMAFSQENVKVKKMEFKTDNTEGLNEAWKSIKNGDKFFKAGKGTYRDAIPGMRNSITRSESAIFSQTISSSHSHTLKRHLY